MRLRTVLGFILIILSLYFAYTIFVPYAQAYQFWGLLGPIGLFILNTWWLASYGWIAVITVVLFILGICFMRGGSSGK